MYPKPALPRSLRMLFLSRVPARVRSLLARPRPRGHRNPRAYRGRIRRRIEPQASQRSLTLPASCLLRRVPRRAHCIGRGEAGAPKGPIIGPAVPTHRRETGPPDEACEVRALSGSRRPRAAPDTPSGATFGQHRHWSIRRSTGPKELPLVRWGGGGGVGRGGGGGGGVALDLGCPPGDIGSPGDFDCPGGLIS